MTTLSRRSPNQWQELIKQQIESGLTATEFCKQHELGFNYFCKRKRAINPQNKTDSQINDFIKLQPVPQTKLVNESGLIVQYHETQLYISSEMDPKWLAQLLQALS